MTSHHDGRLLWTLPQQAEDLSSADGAVRIAERMGAWAHRSAGIFLGELFLGEKCSSALVDDGFEISSDKQSRMGF